MKEFVFPAKPFDGLTDRSDYNISDFFFNILLPCQYRPTDNLHKQFGPRSGLTKQSGLNIFDTDGIHMQ